MLSKTLNLNYRFTKGRRDSSTERSHLPDTRFFSLVMSNVTNPVSKSGLDIEAMCVYSCVSAYHSCRFT